MGYAQAHIGKPPLQLLDNQGRTMTKEEEFTQAIRDGGNWVAVESEILGKIVDEFLKTKQRFPDELAEVDVRYWADKGKIKPPGFYARRWKWGRTTVYDFLKKRGLVEPKKLRTSSEQSSEQTPNKNLGNQPEIKEPPNTARTPLRTSSEQYIQTTDKRDISLAREATPPIEVWPKPEPPPPNPTNPQITPPDDDAVKAWASLAGVPPDEAVNIADHFRANEWEDRNGNPIRNWQAKIRSAHNGNKARNKHTTHGHEKTKRTPKRERTLDGNEQLEELNRRIAARQARENSGDGVGTLSAPGLPAPDD